MSTLSRRASAAPLRTSVSSPLVGIVEGQRAHLTLANTGGRHGATSACEATLAFVDDQRGCSSSRPSASAPGQGAFLALDWNEAAPDDRGRLHYRAVVTPLNDGCNGAIAGHEMVENATQKTTVFIGVYEE
ncbi:MAG: hypothetical protein DMD78_01555 [Candidatus Rokuibacteriota bacterium]|nr:MAG: hypothetical protein DMD78_01555 [Candidatus Rokubacteria bacterium]